MEDKKEMIILLERHIKEKIRFLNKMANGKWIFCFTKGKPSGHCTYDDEGRIVMIRRRGEIKEAGILNINEEILNNKREEYTGIKRVAEIRSARNKGRSIDPTGW